MSPRVFSQTFCVVGGILEKNGKILLVKEASRKDKDGGKWNHPAGWLDVGEEPVVGAKREIEEESGLGFEPTHLLGIYSLVRSDRVADLGATPHAIKLIFVGNITHHEPKPLHDDISETRWFEPEEIYQMDISSLRDIDIKQAVKDYFLGNRYTLGAIKHTIQITTSS